MMTAKAARMIAERYAKAVELVEAGRVAPVYGQDGVYCVLNGEGVAYLVNLAAETCTCPDYQYRAQRLGVPCKHQLAVALYRERPQPDPDGGGRGRSPRRRYQCDRCGSVVESDEDRTGERCLACLAIDPTAPRGRYQPVDEDERCERCGSELDEHGECGACIAEHERTYGGSLVRDADGIVTEVW
jgi:predicted nucleic acid-binding Zn finger protein/DNA-directed RNA polymerase subunit RPC12/RpoP